MRSGPCTLARYSPRRKAKVGGRGPTETQPNWRPGGGGGTEDSMVWERAALPARRGLEVQGTRRWHLATQEGSGWEPLFILEQTP